MSSLAVTESNNLFSSFIHELATQEILAATGKPLAKSYAKIASRMFSLGLKKAAVLAEENARKHDTNKVARIMRNAGYLMDRFVYMIRAMLPADIFVRIKKWIFRLQASRMRDQ
jgi:hypothetical protein